MKPPASRFVFIVFSVFLFVSLISFSEANEGELREKISPDPQPMIGIISSSEAGPSGLKAVITLTEPLWPPAKGKNSRQEELYGGASLNDYYAPLPVFFGGSESSPRSEIISYEWNFGDGTTAKGLNAAHVYEKPGTYTATLKVRNSKGETSPSASVTIKVREANGKKFWVDSVQGNDDWNGLCENPPAQSEKGACGPWRTATKAFLGMKGSFNDISKGSFYKPGDQVIFKRGQVFEMSEIIILGHYQGGYGYTFRASDGPGSKPVIKYTGSEDRHLVVQRGLGLGHLAFVDLVFEFRSPAGVNSGGLLFNAGWSRNILLLRSEFYDPRNAVFLLQANSVGGFLIDSVIKDRKVYPNSSTHLYFEGGNLAILNTTFDLSGNHIVYTHSVDRGVVSNNNFSRPAFGRTALRVSGFSNDFQISDNKFMGWIDPETQGNAHNGGGKRYNWRLVHLGPNKSAFQMVQDVIFENNILLIVAVV